MEYNAPPLLTVYGDTELLAQPSVAIVGSRDPSQRGLLLAEELAAWCATNERPVVSGGAQGIDITAHHAALEHGGSTIFMVPEGAATRPASSATRSVAPRTGRCTSRPMRRTTT